MELKVSVTEEMFKCGFLFESQTGYIFIHKLDFSSILFVSSHAGLFISSHFILCFLIHKISCLIYLSSFFFLSLRGNIMNDIHTPLPAAQLPGSAAGRC